MRYPRIFCHPWHPSHGICTPDTPPGALVQVEDISLAVTTLRGADNVRQYYPNTQMVGASIVNLSRSDNKFDNFTVRAASRFVTLAVLCELEKAQSAEAVAMTWHGADDCLPAPH